MSWNKIMIRACPRLVRPITLRFMRLLRQGRAAAGSLSLSNPFLGGFVYTQPPRKGSAGGSWLRHFARRPPHPSRLLCLTKSCSLLLLFLLPQILFASPYHFPSDSSQKDTSKTHEKKPQRAALLSTCLPGLGQAYNKKYWKIPIVYGLIGTLSYIAWNDHQNYLIFRDALRSRYDNDPNTTDNFPNINDQVLKAQREYYRRNRDMFIIFSFLAYGLNILDAYVDAHLKGFTVSDKLSLKPIPHFNHFQIALIWKIN